MIPKSSAVFVTVWPDLTRATTRARNSSGYLRGIFRAFHSGLNSTPKVETTPAAGQNGHPFVHQPHPTAKTPLVHFQP